MTPLLVGFVTWIFSQRKEDRKHYFHFIRVDESAWVFQMVIHKKALLTNAFDVYNSWTI